jgi:hydroxymethylbilane synthase
MVPSPLRIATRSSELALWQARHVQEALRARGVESELRTYRTTGDRQLDAPLSGIGAKGLFTKELELDLANARVDLCVHSLKDLPTELPPGLAIGAVLRREDPRDVLVVSAALGVSSLEALPRGARVGTSSLRRRAQLLALRPDLEVTELRGNVPTRVRKVHDGVVDAAILAAAGLRRLGITQHISAYLDAPAWLPAAGQGAIALEIRADDERVRALVGPLADPDTQCQVAAERAFLAALEGGCQVPIGALAMTHDGRSTLFGFIADVGGQRVLRGDAAIDAAGPAHAGVQLADALRREGAGEILDGLRQAQPVPAPQPE